MGDLCRCTLIHREESVGRVVSVVESGPSFLLEVELFKGKTVLIPFVDAWVGEVKIEDGTIELRNPEILE
jgi:ribosomal 30S subunit maturation factor RimM